ncbi:hypothetical protein [Kitasatospora sp. NBC_01302]|uniref:hypothetical protein n=1 Tax=Kitasatospora sp. NBC_01302 TaxID=2903575 RepID=UPI002E13D18D|nr:hypothetical protein OG294_14130 [Kitasatospora sp. NBC_01302]
MSALVSRPTENAAIGRIRPRPLGPIGRLQALLAHAVRCHDHVGANLLRHAVARALAGGKVGVA